MTRPDHEIDAYLEGELSAEQARALEAWINADPENARAFLHLVQTHQILGQRGRDVTLGRQLAQDQPATADGLDDAMEASPPDSQALEALLQIEAAADASDVHEVGAILAQLSQDETEATTPPSPRPITIGDVGWAAGKLLRPVIFSKYAATSAAAAMLILATLLWGPWDSENSEPVVQRPTPTVIQTQASVVATLSAERDARWFVGAGDTRPRVGSELHAGQRLTLTSGYADLTTNDGAVAILEAPCTIELIDNGNALRLVRGRLMGVVESESAQGFLVRTQSMDVFDLGTRFGIAVDQADNTLTEVFEGLVEVRTRAAPREQTVTRQLTRGEAFAVNAAGREIARESFAPDTFAQLGALNVSIAELSGGVRWAPAAAFLSNRQDWPTGEQAFIFEEVVRHRLETDITVTAAEPDTGINFGSVAPTATIPADTIVRSYILLFNPVSGSGTQTAQGSITFEGEVLGLSTSAAQWAHFVNATQHGTFDLNAEFEKDLWPEISDQIVLSEDGRTLTFSLAVNGFYDMVRVIVREPAGDAQR